ncbi:MAG TPA: DUF998 domain-containing protein [Candidatus Hydrogenedentes bacterium]|nr:DUF998 domain-containing protein [Candidatus Hydrogenedentota bacterium]
MDLIRRCTPWLGLVGPVPVLLGTIAAYKHYSGDGYSFLRQAISDLGDPTRSPWAWAFNSGMMASGLCIALFIAGAARQVNRPYGYAIAAAGIVTTLGMMGIGVFTAEGETQIPHYLSAGIAFSGILILSTALSFYLPFGQQDVLPRWLVAPSALTAGYSILFLVLLIASRIGFIADSALLIHSGTGKELIHLITTLEWVVLGNVLLLCFSTALSLIPKRQRKPHQNGPSNPC